MAGCVLALVIGACNPTDDTVATSGAGGSAGSGGSGGTVGADDSPGTATGGGGSSGTGGSAGAFTEAGADAVAEASSCPDGAPPIDSDFDGVPDCLDGCPSDDAKRAPGICGCGVSDVDSDLDGTPDCQDMCPGDTNKLGPGVCGCGIPDTDSDGDGVFDCNDECAKDPTKTAAGPCGCLDFDDAGLCLAHRYSFNDAPGSTTAVDTGHAPTPALANGTIVHTMIGANDAGTGGLVLAGTTSDQYMSLPAGTITALGNSATFEAWLTWNPVNPSQWQRVFDFGSSSTPMAQGTGVTYLFLSPRAGSGNLRVAFTLNSNGAEDLVEDTMPLPAATVQHVAVVVDGAAHNMMLYKNGVVVPNGSTGVALRPGYALTRLNDANNWIGRSQWAPDEEFAGTMFEFRIYSRALPAGQILADFNTGPDLLPSDDAGAAVADAAADVSGQ